MQHVHYEQTCQRSVVELIQSSEIDLTYTASHHRNDNNENNSIST